MIRFSNAMVGLVYEIRRAAPKELKNSIKLTNSSLYAELKHYYLNSASEASKSLIKELFRLAEQQGVERTTEHDLERNNSADANTPPKKRNSTSSKNNEEEETNRRRKRIYRGQVIYD